MAKYLRYQLFSLLGDVDFLYSRLLLRLINCLDSDCFSTLTKNVFCVDRDLDVLRLRIVILKIKVPTIYFYCCIS